MSPLVQRARANPADQHWSMLLLESLSGGVLTLAIGIAAVLALVGIYGIIVWPLTFWDMANLGLEKYAEWGHTVLWSVFAGGSLAGYWCFSGAAFKNRSDKDRSKRRNKSADRAAQSRR